MARRGTQKGIVRWLTRGARRVEDVAGFRLYCDAMDSGGAEIMRWPAASTRAPEDLAREAMEAAQDDCDGRGTATAYRLVLLAGEFSEPVITYTLRLEPEDSNGLESASMSGLIQQLMRHNEASARANASLLSQTMQHYSTLIDTMSKRLLALETERRVALETEAEALRSLAVADADQAADAQRAELTAKGVRLLEMVAAKAMAEGGKAAPVTPIKRAPKPTTEKGKG